MQSPRLLIRVTRSGRWLGVSTNSIYAWQRLFSRLARVIQGGDAQADEIHRLKWDLARVISGRDILKNRPGSLPGYAR